MIKLTRAGKITLNQDLQLAYASLTSVVGGPLPSSPCRDAGYVRNYPEKVPKSLACEQLGNVPAGFVATYPKTKLLRTLVDQAPCLYYRNKEPASYIGS